LLCFRSLAALLDADQPVYGFQPLGLDGQHAPHRTIEDIAAYNIEQMQLLQPSGPYYLVGYSMGAVVAFEMAQQLHRNGHPLGLVALLDSPPGVPEFASVAERTWLHLRYILSADVPDPMHHLAERIRIAWQAARRGFRKSTHSDIVGQLLLSAVNQSVAETHLGAFCAYQPQYYPGRLTLFRARFRLGYKAPVFADPTFGWSELAESIDVRWIPGAHMDILKGKGIEALSRGISTCLYATTAVKC
jgi:thioesterase domain-containing protein